MATEILRPNAIGDEENIYDQYPDSGDHYNKVDESSPDGYDTFVRGGDFGDPAGWCRDFYNIANSGVGAGTINHITVHAYCRADAASPTNTSLKIAVKAGTGVGAPDTPDESAEKTLTGGTNWTDYTNQWATNPATSAAWTWDEIDNLQIGVTLRSHKYPIAGGDSICTQLWVVVDYVSGWTGKVSGVTNPTKVPGVAVANIGKVMGVS